MSQSVFIVTGGAGFIGSNLVAELYRRQPDARVVVIDDFRTGSFANLVEACERKGVGAFRGEVYPDSVTDLNWQPAVEGLEPRAVFHLAAITDTTVSDEQSMLRVNAESFTDIAQACAEVGVPLVYASSAATYGTPPQAARREAFPIEAAGRPDNVYGFSKWLMETEHARIAESCAQEQGKRPWIVGLRFFNVFGPCEARKGKMASMVYQLACQVLSGQKPRLFRDGTQSRDQVYVDDVVSCTLAAAGLGEQPDPAPGVYNLGSGVATSFNQIVQSIGIALGKAEPIEVEYFDMPESIRAFYQDFTCADMSETKRGLGWSPSHDPLEAMRAYVAYLAERPNTWKRGGSA
ncbi:MAG: NAD-dependent epimerase/dehydratase family protein [Planctomycetota bacterium]|nr:MAG: NAD-dependent epimerase/dehydratase family protein [Planctomycetota bacterium]